MTDQFDNFQLDPNTVGDDWTFSGQQSAINQKPSAAISNPQYHFVGARHSADRTRVVLEFERKENPEKTVNDAYLGWGVDWSLFNYNPYGGRGDGNNPNFKIHNDFLQITGLGNISVVADDVSDKDAVEASGMVAYYNYPSEGYNSFGKKGDKRWAWQGNSWIAA